MIENIYTCMDLERTVVWYGLWVLRYKVCQLITTLYLPFSTFTKQNKTWQRIHCGLAARRTDLPLFYGNIELYKAHEKMMAMAGSCVWMYNFVPVNSPQKRLVEYLL